MADERTRLLPPSPSGEIEDSDPMKMQTNQRNIILIAIWIGVFLGALDTTIVATLVSSISSSFESSNQSSWLGTSYLLSTATFTCLYGRLSDCIGRRNSSLAALIFFTVGTAICGFANSMVVLIVGRFIAGMGGGGMMVMSSIICSDLVPLKQRGLFQGMANVFFGLGAGLGGPVGGFLADLIGWRWAFLIQLPVLLLSFLMVTRFIHYKLPSQAKSTQELLQRIDYHGAIALILSLGPLLLALSYKNNDNLAYSNPKVFINLIIFFIFTITFILIEAHYALEPILPMRILNTRNGAFVALTNFFMSMVSFSVLYFLPLFFEVVLQQSSTLSGSHLLPNSVALSLGSLFAGFIMRSTGKYYYLTVFSAFLPVMALGSLASLRENSSWALLWLGVVPSGFGFSSVVTSILIALIASVEKVDMAAATGITYLFRYVGQVVGVAISSSILQSILTTQLHSRIKGEGAAEIIDKIRHVSNEIGNLPFDLKRDAIESYQIAISSVFIWNGGIAFICFLCTLGIREFNLPGSLEEEEAEEIRKKSVAETVT